MNLSKNIKRLEKIFLAEKLEYQEKSIISRKLIQKETGSITLYAFDKDEVLSEHTTPFETLVYILEGMVEITVKEELFKLKEGEIIILPENIPHKFKALKKLKMVMISIKEDQKETD
ncbi:MAG: cupin domain-containing protein [Candidatus Heimdallarchaeota archaeon]|nr:cupin domain-containing protein [Candidatus Heimdallarchaeota archaeon]